MNENFTAGEISFGVLRIAYDVRFDDGMTEDGFPFDELQFFVDGKWVSKREAQAALFADANYHQQCEDEFMKNCRDEEFPQTLYVYEDDEDDDPRYTPPATLRKMRDASRKLFE